MSGRSSAALALALAMLVTGVAFATPVPVLGMRGPSGERAMGLADGEALTYSYRQSIYLAVVHEDLVRRGDRLALLRVRSPDIRSVEYFRWDGNIVQDSDGLWTQDAPPTEQRELVIRVVPDGEQRIRTAGATIELLRDLGEGVVTIRPERLPRALALLRGAG